MATAARIADGGPAFPRPAVRIENSSGDVSWFDEQDGMSIRDYFASAALPAVMAARTALVVANLDGLDTSTQESIAEECYELADALLLARDGNGRE